MTAISTRTHEKMKEFAAGCTAPDSVLRDLQLLEQLYTCYQDKLFALRQLIQEYDKVHRRVRMELRKQQVSLPGQYEVG